MPDTCIVGGPLVGGPLVGGLWACLGLGPAPHGKMRLPPTARRNSRYAAILAGLLSEVTGCQQPKPTSTETSVVTTGSVAPPSPELLSTVPSSTLLPASGVETKPLAARRFHGKGTTSAVKLELPGNQGVQLSWVQDKGTAFVGPIELELDVKPDGTMNGTLTGSLGELAMHGNWDGTGPLQAKLSAKKPAPDAFNGLFTAEFLAPTSAEGRLRVTSNDGRWVRQANVKLAPSQ